MGAAAGAGTQFECHSQDTNQKLESTAFAVLSMNMAWTTVASRQGQGQRQGHAQGHRHPPQLRKVAASYNFSGNLQGYIIRKLKLSREFAICERNTYPFKKYIEQVPTLQTLNVLSMVSITRIIK